MTSFPPLGPATGAVGAVISYDYLKFDRPEFYESTTSAKGGVVKNPKSIQNPNPMVTVITIAASAFIFIVIVAWFSVIQNLIDSAVVSDELYNVALSRLYYAIVTTLIGAVALSVFFIWYSKLTSQN